MRLLGPRPFDLTAPAQSAGVMLASWSSNDAVIADPFEEADGSQPGLYLLVDDQDALLGFWLTFGDGFLEEGPGPGRVPPFAEDLLEAATEAIWWERLKVAPLKAGRWQPLIVLEWPPVLADRCGSPPPGPRRSDEDDELEPDAWGDEPATSWIEPVSEAPPSFDEPDYIPTALRRWDELPERRSVVTLIRGDLGRRAGLHDGSFELAALKELVVAEPRGIPMERWVVEAQPGNVPELPGLMEPLRLPGDRTGFPLPGWLARDLEPTPPEPSDHQRGELVSRDIHNRFWGQVALATAITGLVLLCVLGFSGGVHFASLPRLNAAVAVPIVDAQPAMSVCSPDHNRFVDALRCQIRHLADGGAPGEADCSGPDPHDDLQPAYCGLHDRTLDGWVDEQGHGYAALAAASACYDVLGSPFPYARQGTDGKLPDPERLLTDPQLKVSSLVDLVAELDTTCSVYRDKIEARVSGAVLATHVGNRSTEGEALRDLVFDQATTGASGPLRACWTTGRAQPLDRNQTLGGLCGPDPAESVVAQRKGWRALGGISESSVTTRYVQARFGQAATARGVWECHRELDAGTGGPPIRGHWDLVLPRPRSYSRTGVVSQLQLDAGLSALREVGADDACWEAVDGMLGRYEPVHPLLEDVTDDTWPSEEQQVCGQVCAAAYGLSPRPDRWVTPGTDLTACVEQSPATSPVEGRLDQLTLPWNKSPDETWVEPTLEQVCAFNLVAQGRLQALADPNEAPLWSGENGAGSGLAGGPDGAAVRAAEALGAYGRNRSTATCRQVATQCFAGELVSTLGENRTERHRWAAAWRRKVADISRVAANEVTSPWCRLVRPYLQEDGSLPEGEFDFPCALGVDQARRQLEGRIAVLASGSFGDGGPP